jgi:predicted glycosyltransferase
VIAVYAIGGGAGHVTRARRVIDALGLRGNAFILGTPSDPRAAGDIPLVEIPRALEGDLAAHRTWLRTIDCERMLVDVFPAGIQGELSGFDRRPLDFIARILRVDEYRKATNDAPWPKFGTAYVVEEGAPEVDAGRVQPLNLAPPQQPSNQATKQPYWLVVHSGPQSEIDELVAYARELTTAPIVVADTYPATDLMPGAARIITAAGFNVMLETEPWREKHLFVPFPRRFDDQFARAARRRAATLRA